jgi:hypothetical protein
VVRTETGLSTSVTIGPHSAFRQSERCSRSCRHRVYGSDVRRLQRCPRAERGRNPPRLGFLLGTRRYLATRAWFVDGERLVVSSELAWRDEEIGVFDCLIRSGDDVVAQAQLIVSEPKSVPGSPGWSE